MIVEIGKQMNSEVIKMKLLTTLRHHLQPYSKCNECGASLEDWQLSMIVEDLLKDINGTKKLL